MRVRNFGAFNLVVAQAVCQTAELNSLPNFPAIWYVCLHKQLNNESKGLIHVIQSKGFIQLYKASLVASWAGSRLLY